MSRHQSASSSAPWLARLEPRHRCTTAGMVLRPPTAFAGRRAAGARPDHPTPPRATAPAGRAVAPAGPISAKPLDVYRSIDRQPGNRAIMALFRRKMVAALQRDSDRQGYDAIVELTHQLNRQFPTARGTQSATRAILKSLFPAWLPGAFKVRPRSRGRTALLHAGCSFLK